MLRNRHVSAPPHAVPGYRLMLESAAVVILKISSLKPRMCCRPSSASEYVLLGLGVGQQLQRLVSPAVSSGSRAWYYHRCPRGSRQCDLQGLINEGSGRVNLGISER